MARGWLTPDTIPAGITCRTLFIPDSEAFIALVTGALNSLVEVWNFEEFGALTPQQTANAFVDMFDKFSYKQGGGCRMIGEIVPYAGETNPLPEKWLLCDGSSLERSGYPDLFIVVGTQYGVVDSSHFNLPDIRGRVGAMAGAGAGLTARSIGDSTGEETHQLSINELASHDHVWAGYLEAVAVTPGELPVLIPPLIPSVTGAAGGDVAHNNMQPTLFINYYIVAKD